MMMPSIVAAALLVFVSAASCYGIPSIIGAPGNIDTVTTRIIDFVYLGSSEGLSDATTLAVFLMLVANIILYLSTFVVGRKQYRRKFWKLPRGRDPFFPSRGIWL